MRIRRAGVCAGIFLAWLGPATGAWGGTPEVEALLKVIPGDAPVAAVIVDMVKLDKSMGAAVKMIQPDAEYDGMLEGMKNDLPIGGWVDFSKPVGLALLSLGGGPPMLWVTVPNFAEKVKGVANAKEENGVWSIPFEGGRTVYAKVKGAYVAATTEADAIALVDKTGPTLADTLKDRADLLKDRDALIHVNFDAIRPMVTGQLTQLAQMAPMVGMMMGAQAGGDPAAMVGALTAGLDGLKKFVDQVAYLDVVVGVTDAAGTITLAAGFTDGEVKNYLAKQKPAQAALLTELEEQPYLVAMGCHIPGTDSPFFDYVFDKVGAAMAGGAAPGGGAPGAPPGSPDGAPAAASPDPAKTEAAKAAMQVSRDLYRKVEGWNSLIAFSPGGMRVSGDYLGGDAPGILDLAKKSLASANPAMKSFNGGASYESLGPVKVGEVNVDQFALKLDTSNPAMAQAAMLLGTNSKFSLGIVGGKVRYCMGSEEDAKKTFAAKIEKPLTANKAVAEVVAALPAKRNAVVLIDPGGIIPFIGPMMGMPPAEPMPPGPPVGISLSISGEPARLDIHVPFRAITRVVEALTPKQPT